MDLTTIRQTRVLSVATIGRTFGVRRDGALVEVHAPSASLSDPMRRARAKGPHRGAAWAALRTGRSAGTAGGYSRFTPPAPRTCDWFGRQDKRQAFVAVASATPLGTTHRGLERQRPSRREREQTDR
jgi:hypothetical protein